MNAIYGLSSMTYQRLSKAVLGRKHLLLHCLDRDVARSGAGRGFTDGSSIDVVVFIAGNVRFYMLRRDQLHLMPERYEFPGKPVRTAAGLHHDGARL